MGHYYRVLLLSTFVLLNVLTPIVIALLVPVYYYQKWEPKLPMEILLDAYIGQQHL